MIRKTNLVRSQGIITYYYSIVLNVLLYQLTLHHRLQSRLNSILNQLRQSRKDQQQHAGNGVAEAHQEQEERRYRTAHGVVLAVTADVAR